IVILVNGSPICSFNLERGIRQGDPLAPFLYLIVAETFTQLLRIQNNRGLL
ncbi:hypothetical protein M569_05772, partial [Genlisea aurea]